MNLSLTVLICSLLPLSHGFGPGSPASSFEYSALVPSALVRIDVPPAAPIPLPAAQDDPAPPPPKPAPVDPPVEPPVGTDSSSDDSGKKPGPDGAQKPPVAPPTKSDAPAVPLVSDKVALEHLQKAVDRQGGAALKGAVNALHLKFAKAVGHRAGGSPDANAQGGFETDRGGLEISWLAPNLIRTKMVINGKTKIRGQFIKFGKATAWMHDGTTYTTLTGEKYAKDVKQLTDQLELVQALLDVALLRRMQTDGSVWRIDAKAQEADKDGAILLLRVPPKTKVGESEKLPLIVRLDPKTYLPLGLLILPRQAGDPLLRISLKFEKSHPTVEGGGDARFPFEVHVEEKATPESKFEKVVDLWVESVKFNAAAKLTPADFRNPATIKKK